MNERKISVVRKHEEEPNRAKENTTEIESILEGTTNQMIQRNRLAIWQRVVITQAEEITKDEYMLLEMIGEITPERMNGWSQSKTIPSCGCYWLQKQGPML